MISLLASATGYNQSVYRSYLAADSGYYHRHSLRQSVYGLPHSDYGLRNAKTSGLKPVTITDHELPHSDYALPHSDFSLRNAKTSGLKPVTITDHELP